MYEENYRITPAAQGGAAGSVRRLLTKNPARSLNCPGFRVSRLNGSRGSGRQLTERRASSSRPGCVTNLELEQQ